ncbi:MAG: hypothetical protein QOK40_2109 [Miltoncostaeaceae bacterium]|jgi:hypothetical protein|nr:hypothetical protein [Miltoncostaeaceae bacterium]
MRRRPACAAAALAALAILAGPALAGPPYPQQRQGSGLETTGGGGLVMGAPFRARAALVGFDRRYGELRITLAPRRVGCAAIGDPAAIPAPYVVALVTPRPGRRLPVGRALAPPAVGLVQASFVSTGSTYVGQRGVRLVLTRVDTARHALWRGRLTVPRVGAGRSAYAFRGTFAATWCG